MTNMSLLLLLVVVAVSLAAAPTTAFYLPGVAPIDYQPGDPVALKVVNVDSVRTQMPLEYYHLPFCKNSEVVETTENLGEVLAGDNIESSDYELRMKHMDSCKVLCRRQYTREELKLFADRIEEEYFVNWIVDNMPAASRYYSEDEDGTISTTYLKGFPLGFVGSREIPGSAPGVKYINNHARIVLFYHKHTPSASSWGADPQPGQDTRKPGYRIVGFEVEAYSVRHEIIGEWAGKDTRFETCNSPITNGLPPQPVSGPETATEAQREIVWTYDVKWESSPIKWASRWDVYLKMTNAKIHWFSILNSFIIVVFLTAMVALIMVKTLRRDFSIYNALAQDAESSVAQEAEETGWKLVSREVFRPPRHGGLLSVFVGSGVQLWVMTALTIVFAMLGFLSPSSRGSLLVAILTLFVLTGSFSGYVATTLYRSFQMTRWKRNALFTALMFPGACFTVFFGLDLALWAESSSAAVPFSTLVGLQLLWFGIATPLVYFGALLASRKPAWEPPYRTNAIPRIVPDQPWYLNGPFTVFAGGVLPFGAVFVELFFIMTSVWMHRFYYAFGFLFLVLVILMATCAEISIVLTYFQLCAEDYHWWWRSFLTSGASAVFLFLYSVMYFFTRLEITEFVPTMLYFGYMGIVTFAFFLLTGSIGFIATSMFVRKIYTSIKVD
eukprot:TRINITY_DN65723_c9_g16_i1.p2 TRINITY_DN65723_c9_g16~~TRINITY_DN65723_c9_g16_i1.p2  ORF type:complete len:675 (+),score=326.36 TRINITY_DN65723_c9_g16_i1:24-2027(+)